MTTTMYYNDANLLTGEAYSGATAILNDMSVTNVFDAYLRRTGLTGRKGGTHSSAAPTVTTTPGGSRPSPTARSTRRTRILPTRP
jgi:hypothetical protein